MSERHFAPLQDPFSVTLQGTALLEAGAGTGKTWTIAALVLRLLLEQRFEIGQIQVVTYTRAATAELRGRIRARLGEALAAFAAGQADESFLAVLVRQHEAGQAMARLRLAIESFDEAAIHTIHGFCQRALMETAFAAGLPFERELVADPGELLERLAQDHWRKLMAEATRTGARLWTAWLLEAFEGPGGLLRPVASHLGRHEVQLAAPAAIDLAPLESHYGAAYAVARQQWQSVRGEIQAWLDKAQLKKNMWPVDKRAARIAAADLVFAADEAPWPWPEALERWGAREMVRARSQASPPADLPFFAAIDDWHDAFHSLKDGFERATRRLVHDFLVEVRQGLDEAKRRRGLQAYDDLLVDLAAALRGPRGETLAAQLRQRCRAVLVDEFQDTDPLQLQIFFGAFGHGEHPLIFVGDPKQAIYGFRGADVFAYLSARQRAAAGYALRENRRSDPPLLQAVNALFARPRPLLLENLPYEPAVAAVRTREPCEIADAAAPLTLWWLESPKPDGFSKEAATQQVVEAVACDIRRLLGLSAAGQARIGGRALGGGDIAVLVRKRQQGEAVRLALARHGITSASLGGGSIWQTEEAEEVERVLLALAAPQRIGLVRAALATRLIGLDAAALLALEEGGIAWEARLQAFLDDQAELRERGFMAMWRGLLRRERVVERMLARRDGERRLTNYRHLAERLQVAEHAFGLDGEGLARHIARERERGNAGKEENQLRLESDAALVRIVTIHAAKGLEYPVVYCPFLWDGPSADAASWPVLAHVDTDAGGEAHLDFGSDDIDRLRALADHEAAAEELRLAYVALTRARHRCVLAVGKINQFERSPLAWLLFGPRDPEVADPRGAMAARLANCTAAELRAEAERLAGQLDGAFSVQPVPGDAGPIEAALAAPAQVLAARRFSGTLPAPWPILSFSSLARQAPEAELPDRDATPRLDAVLPAPSFSGIGIGGRAAGARLVDFPRGTQAGSCLHALLERVDFQHLASADMLATNVLAEYGLDATWAPVLVRMLQDVVATPLDDSGLSLDQVPRHARLIEMEFNFPLASPAAHAGYMKGFIDLVFRHEGRWYIIDYKSNWLGDQPDDYAPERLSEAMRLHRYDLQARIYAAALQRALSAREPGLPWEERFGGIFYLFLRGIQPGSSHGILSMRPTALERVDWLREAP